MPVVFGLGACLGLEKTGLRFKWFTQITRIIYGLPKSVRQRQRSCLFGRDLRSLWQTDFATPLVMTQYIAWWTCFREPFHHSTFSPFHLQRSRHPRSFQESRKSPGTFRSRGLVIGYIPMNYFIMIIFLVLLYLPALIL